MKNMYREMCGRIESIVEIIGKKEKIYEKIIERVERKEEKNRERIVKVEKGEIGEIECIRVEYGRVEIKIIRKKEYSKSEKYFTRYIIDKSEFKGDRKYIGIIVERGKGIEEVVEAEGIRIIRIGKEEIEKIKETVKRMEIIERLILPEFNRYIKNHSRIQRELSRLDLKRDKEEGDRKIYYGFENYLKYIKDYREEDNKSN